jgi:hypothetical protein
MTDCFAPVYCQKSVLNSLFRTGNRSAADRLWPSSQFTGDIAQKTPPLPPATQKVQWFGKSERGYYVEPRAHLLPQTLASKLLIRFLIQLSSQATMQPPQSRTYSDIRTIQSGTGQMVSSLA